MDGSFNLAVHALVCLSHSGRSLSSEALAENICTNPARVRRVMAGLKRAGMVETREGQMAATACVPSLRGFLCGRWRRRWRHTSWTAHGAAGILTGNAPSAPAWQE